MILPGRCRLARNSKGQYKQTSARLGLHERYLFGCGEATTDYLRKAAYGDQSGIMRGGGVNRLLLAGGVVFGAMLAPAAAADMPKSRIG